MSHDEEPLDTAPRNVATSDDTDSVDSDTILPIRHSHSSRRSGSPVWSRRSIDGAQPPRPKTRTARWIQTARGLPKQAITTFIKLPLPQRIAAVLGVLILLTLLILCIVFYSKILGFWAWCARNYRDVPFGWLIMWAATFIVSFPPLIGYSTIVSLAGMVYGMAAWPIIASATILGSTASFVVSRGILRSYVERLTSKSKKFTALAMVLKHDGLKLLIMIRICPLPYSLANGVISTIPTVTWPNFMLATAIASPNSSCTSSSAPASATSPRTATRWIPAPKSSPGSAPSSVPSSAPPPATSRTHVRRRAPKPWRPRKSPTHPRAPPQTVSPLQRATSTTPPPPATPTTPTTSPCTPPTRETKTRTGTTSRMKKTLSCAATTTSLISATASMMQTITRPPISALAGNHEPRYLIC
ncbi:hypothetical protein MRB53_037737 [Persea americana]|nr:hypothetical protein MRB53_037737 [Persea americana]